AAHRLRRAGQLRALFQDCVRERRQLRRRTTDEHHQSRGAQGAPLSDAAGSAAAGSVASAPAAAVSELRRRQGRWSLLFGNFVIGCGVMVVVGTLTAISRSLDVSVSVAGQLITVAAVVMCFGAPLLAGWIGGLDRRKLLAASLAWYAIGHALCALVPSFAALVPVRALTVLGAAVFTPQAAAARRSRRATSTASAPTAPAASR